MKRLLLALLILPALAFSQVVYPPEGTTTGLDTYASGVYNLCSETAVNAPTTGTIKEVLATCTIPADSLGGSNDFAGFEIHATYETAANANSKTVGVDVGSVGFLSRATTGNAALVTLHGYCYVSASDGLACGAAQTYESTGELFPTPTPSDTFTFSSGIDVEFFGTTATALGDVTLQSYRVALISANDYFPGSGVFWPLLAPGGSVDAPSYSFAGYPTTGIRNNSGHIVLQGQRMTGTDQAATGTYIKGGVGTGTGGGGFLSMEVALPAASSGSTSNTLQTVLSVNGLSGALTLGGLDSNSNIGTTTFAGVDASTATTDEGGGLLYIRPGVGTGTGAGGTLRLQVAPAGTVSGSSQNSAQNVLYADGGPGNIRLGGLEIGSGAPADVEIIGNATPAGVTDGDGGNLNLQGGFGTGAGTPGTIQFQTGTTLGSGSTQQTATTRMTVGEAAITNTIPLLAPDGVRTAPSYSFSANPTVGTYAGANGAAGMTARTESGTDQSSTAAAVIHGGAGTGTGGGGDVRLYVYPASTTSGSTVNTSQAAFWAYGSSGQIIVGGLNVGGSAGAVHIRGTDIYSGVTDGDGGTLEMRGGLGTGAGAPGVIRFRTGSTLGSGGTAQSETTRMTITETDVTTTVPLLALDGSATLPAYSFADNTTAGLWDSSDHIVLQGKRATGTDTSSTGTYIRSGIGTGTAAGGSVSIDIAPGGAASGSSLNTLQNAFFAHGAQGYTQLGGVDVNGYSTPAQSLWMGVDSAEGNTDYDGGAVVIQGGRGTGAGAPGWIYLRTGTVLGSGTTQQTGANRLIIKPQGPVVADSGTKPTCDATTRGVLWRDEGGAGVADTFEVCAKNSSDTYAWYALATIP